MLNLTYHPEYCLATLPGLSTVRALVIDKLPDESLAAFSERANREALSWLGGLTSSLGVVVHGVSYDW